MCNKSQDTCFTRLAVIDSQVSNKMECRYYQTDVRVEAHLHVFPVKLHTTRPHPQRQKPETHTEG